MFVGFGGKKFVGGMVFVFVDLLAILNIYSYGSGRMVRPIIDSSMSSVRILSHFISMGRVAGRCCFGRGGGAETLSCMANSS